MVGSVFLYPKHNAVAKLSEAITPSQPKTITNIPLAKTKKMDKSNDSSVMNHLTVKILITEAVPSR